MEQLVVDHERCTQCGQCIYACNRQVLTTGPEGFPELPEKNLIQCNACGHCSAVCSAGAVISPKSGGEPAMPYPDAPDVGFDEARKFILSLRSMRRYTPRPVPREEIAELLEVARRAPSASNAQPVSWAVLSGKAKTERFTALTMDWFDKVLRHDEAFSLRYNIDQMLERYRGGYDTILRGAPNAVLALTDKNAPFGPVDATIALTYFCLAGHAKGIGSCWAGFGMRALGAYAPLRELMGLDDSVAVQGMVFFGYPELEYRALPPRNPLRVTWVA